MKILLFKLKTENDYLSYAMSKPSKCLCNPKRSMNFPPFELNFSFTCKGLTTSLLRVLVSTLSYWKWDSLLSRISSVDSAKALTFHFLKENNRYPQHTGRMGHSPICWCSLHEKWHRSSENKNMAHSSG